MKQKITAAHVKALIDPLCNEDERDFRLIFSERRPRWLKGKYVIRRKLIVLYPRNCRQEFDLEATALHELTHHLVWKRNDADLNALFYQGKRVPRHGRVFKTILEELVREFNFRYGELLPGKMVFEKGRATSGPRFLTPEETLLDILFGVSPAR